MSEAHSNLTRQALDPTCSVVVEACAGSGKTWLLVSRILRLLLAGARPGEILAITYTRKAAREIQARLQDWLRELALGSPEAVLDFLVERGMTREEARRAVPLARGLLESLGSASPAMTVTTFHGWFGRVLKGAAFDSGLAGYTLSEAEAPMREEAWAQLARRCGAQGQGPLALTLVGLLERIGQTNTRTLMDAFIARRAEWQAWLAGGGESVETTLKILADHLGVVGCPEDIVAATLGRGGLREDLLEYAALLGRSTETDRGFAARIVAALAEGTPPQQAYGVIKGVVLTSSAEPRKRKASTAQADRLGGACQDRLLALHGQLADIFLAADEALVAAHILEFNRLGLTVGAALLAAYEDHKRQRRLMDYSDLEWHADRLLADEDRAPFIQARLDARYRHILLDEFQDTNPLQWRILMAWLAAYGADAQPPGVFMVGDPKQAIYRFRRADSRIFHHARDVLRETLAARVLHNDTTFRNAPPVVAVVNTLFEAEGEAFQGFRRQEARQHDLPGRVELLPLVAPTADVGVAPAPGLRNPLTTPLAVAEDLRRRHEAQAMVQRLTQVVGHWQLGTGVGARPARWGDVLILTRRRSVLPEFERALRAAGVPYLSVSRGGLLQTLEAQDLVALLGFLVTPGNDLALAQVLRTPIFSLGDGDLLTLARRAEASWWARLQALAAESGASFAQGAVSLLGAWLEAAPHLPVHDLLDRIYHQGDLVNRYRARVPAPMWPGVRANLEAFMALALELDGGRFPSLSRFVDELARLNQAADEEAPDEGVVSGGGGDERLRLMTIHGAKGLEAPIVWLVDAHNTHRVADGYQPLIEWLPGQPAPSHFSLHSTAKERGRAREALFAQEAQGRQREDLNMLYVALTRARQVFFASGIEAARGQGEGSFYHRIGAAIRALGGEGAFGELPLASTPGGAGVAPVLPAAPAPAITLPVGERRAPVDETPEIRFGIQLHGLLEARTGGRVRRDPGLLEPGVADMAERILAAPALRRFFAPEGILEARNEIEFIAADGSFGRIDRLVRLADGVWILDYKSGRPGEAEVDRHRPQLERYREVIQAIYPGVAVRCGLIFGDASLVEL